MPLAMPPAAGASPIPQAMYAPPAIDFTHSFRGNPGTSNPGTSNPGASNAPATPVPRSEANSPASGEKRSASPSYQDSLRKKQSLDLSIHSLLNTNSGEESTRQKLKDFLDIQIPDNLTSPAEIREYLKEKQREISERLKDLN